jgi:hypothetical protein
MGHLLEPLFGNDGHRVSEAIGSVRSPTETVRYFVPLSRTVCVTTRSSSATPG